MSKDSIAHYFSLSVHTFPTEIVDGALCHNVLVDPLEHIRAVQEIIIDIHLVTQTILKDKVFLFKMKKKYAIFASLIP